MFLKKFENLKITLITYKPTQIFTPFRNTKNFYEFQNAVEGIYKIMNLMKIWKIVILLMVTMDI